MRDMTPEEVAAWAAADGKPTTVRTTELVEGPAGEPVGVTVEELTGVLKVPWGVPPFPPHPDEQRDDL